MRRARLLLVLSAMGLIAAPVAAEPGSERRCGWLVNPTPVNYWLVDRDTRWNGGWLISAQGGYRAPGADEMRGMDTRGWVSTNGHYGYGCACMRVKTDRRRMLITRIYSANPVPIAQCRGDRRLPKPED